MVRGNERSDRDLANTGVRREDRAGQGRIVALDNERATPKGVAGERVSDVEELARVRRLGA